MRILVLFLFLIFTTACGAQTGESRRRAADPPSEIPVPTSKRLVLVELFTSQG